MKPSYLISFVLLIAVTAVGYLVLETATWLITLAVFAAAGSIVVAVVLLVKFIFTLLKQLGAMPRKIVYFVSIIAVYLLVLVATSCSQYTCPTYSKRQTHVLQDIKPAAP
jgi:thiol:disulfide interchange protein